MVIQLFINICNSQVPLLVNTGSDLNILIRGVIWDHKDLDEPGAQAIYGTFGLGDMLFDCIFHIVYDAEYIP